MNIYTYPIPLATHHPRLPQATVHILPQDLLRSVYLVGKTGTGKSALLLRLLLGSLEAGFGICLIDPHGDLALQALEQLPSRFWNQVIFLNPKDEQAVVGLDLGLHQGSPSLVCSGLIEVFRKLWGRELFGPRSEHLLRHSLLVILSNPGTTLISLLRLLVDESYRHRLLIKVTDPLVRTFWLKEFSLFDKRFQGEVMAPVLNKLGALTSPCVRRVLGQTAPRLNLRQVMDQRGILVCDLSGIGRDACELLGALIVTGLGLAAQSRAGNPQIERRPFLLIADEFHTYTTESFCQLLSEGRKFGLCAALAHQHAAQLDEKVRAAVLGNVGTLISFSLSAEDAELLVPEFSPYFTADELVGLRRHRIVLRLLRHGEPLHPELCQTIPPPPRNGGPSETLLRISRERYGRRVETVDREIEEGVGMALPNEKGRPLTGRAGRERCLDHRPG